MTKVLNLDALETAIDKSVILDGKEYFLKPFSVEEFVNQLQEIEQISANNDMTASEIFDTSVRILARGFPDLPQERFRKMSTAQIDHLMNFVRGEMDEELTAGAEAAANAGEAEGN